MASSANNHPNPAQEHAASHGKTGGNARNQDGIAGSPGDPGDAPERVSGQDRDADAAIGGGQSGNDPQRDSPI